VLQRAYDTGNEYFTVEATVRRSASSYYEGYTGSPPEHVHAFQDETYTVRSGKMGYKLGDTAAPVAQGESVTVPKGVPAAPACALVDADMHECLSLPAKRSLLGFIALPCPFRTLCAFVLG
jgi:hypothetical protein